MAIVSEVNIIVPVYNVEKYLNRCIDSILNQTYNNFKLILVDDGSPDKCPVICEEYKRKDNRIIVIHQQNAGLSAARNAGLEFAIANKCKWITFVDSDDYVDTHYLELIVNAAIQLNVPLAIADYKETNGNKVEVNLENANPRIWKPLDYYKSHYINANTAWGKLYSTNLFKNVRFPIGKIHEDEFTTYKLLFQCSSVAVIEQPLYAYFINPNGITRTQWKPQRLNALEAIDERIQFFLSIKNYEMYRKTIYLLLNLSIRNISNINNKNRATRNSYRKLALKAFDTYFRKYKSQIHFKKRIYYFLKKLIWPDLLRLKTNLKH